MELLVVVGDVADRADRVGDVLAFDHRGLDPDRLDERGVDVDCVLRLFSTLLIGVDRDQVHPHRGLARFVRGVGRVHRCAVVKDLPLAGRLGFLGCGPGAAGRRLQGDEVHSADGAGPRMVLDDLGVHAAGVELSGFSFGSGGFHLLQCGQHVVMGTAGPGPAHRVQ